MTKTEKTLLTIFIAIQLATLWIMTYAISPADVAACQGATNYSAERCAVELGR